jgi:hypothetical protein
LELSVKIFIDGFAVKAIEGQKIRYTDHLSIDIFE